jgi:hypothetical protein
MLAFAVSANDADWSASFIHNHYGMHAVGLAGAAEILDRLTCPIRARGRHDDAYDPMDAAIDRRLLSSWLSAEAGLAPCGGA